MNLVKHASPRNIHITRQDRQVTVIGSDVCFKRPTKRDEANVENGTIPFVLTQERLVYL